MTAFGSLPFTVTVGIRSSRGPLLSSGSTGSAAARSERHHHLHRHAVNATTISIGQQVWEQSHPESTYVPKGGVIVDILSAYTDFETGEQIGRRLVCLHYHRGRVQTHVLTEDRLSDLVEPLNVATLRNLYRAIYRELGAHKGQENTHNLALHGWGHRLFSIANEGVA